MTGAGATWEGGVRTLYLASHDQPALAAEAWIQLRIAGVHARSGTAHLACYPRKPPTPVSMLLQELPDLPVIEVDLGPDGSSVATRGRVRRTLASLAAVPSMARLAAYVRSERIELVQSTDRPRDAAAAVVLGRITGVPSVVHLHVGWADWMQRPRRWALEHADAVVTVSGFVASTLPAGLRDPTTVHTVLNGIDPAAWVPGKDRDACREELGIEPGAPVIVTVCRLLPSKGPELLLHALPALVASHPSLRLVIVGDDGSGGRGYAGTLEGVAGELGVAGHVTFTGRRRDVARLLAAADVFAMPSYGEPFGLVYTEAMAMELPVVALAHGGALEVLEHGRTGLLSPPGDLGALTTHLAELLADPARRAEMGAAGRLEVERRFTVERMAADTFAVQRHVLSTRS